MKYSQTWDIESIFKGGAKSEDLQKKLTETNERMVDYQAKVEEWNPEKDSPSYEAFASLLQMSEVIRNALSQMGSFINAVLSTDVTNTHAPVVRNQISQIGTKFSVSQTVLMKKLAAIPEASFQELLTQESFSPVAFGLTELRENGSRLLSEKEEQILATLSPDGFHAWSNLYDTIVPYISIPFIDKDGNKQMLSAGQAMNRMYADPDPAVRAQLFAEWEQAWATYAPLLSETLNHLQGYRLAVYKLRGIEDFMEEPLRYNRIKNETLDAMWGTIEANKQPFIDVLNRKAALMGKEKLDWVDVDAPLPIAEGIDTSFTYDEAVDFIMERFEQFGPELADFTKQLIEKRWVEAEDRPGKRPGGYCTGLPETKESRIFMTFTGSSSDMSTLAHEIGHAFHSYAMREVPALHKNYAMNVAETASTFAETIVQTATVQAASSKEEKIALLNTKLENASAMFLNIHARYLFEKSFYTERQKGLVSAERLNELMVSAQKESYQDALGEYHPHFWASKLHFFISDISFYNFPYTFGFLFSLSIYAEYERNPEGFEQKYMALLRDTASMTTEELVQKHLAQDITQSSFWQQGLDVMIRDAKEFIQLTDSYVS